MTPQEYEARVIERAKTMLAAHHGQCLALIEIRGQLECLPGETPKGLVRAIEGLLPEHMREKGDR